jgi:hypothetical protein
MDKSMAMPIFSMLGSALTFLWTGYFWLVRVKRERPDLRPHLADHEVFLGNTVGETRQIGIKIGLVVANYSSLPNALLGIRLWLRKRDSGWMPIEGVTYDAKTPLPFNVPAMQTVLVRIAGRVSFPTADEIEGTPTTLTNYLDWHSVTPREFGVELRGLRDYFATAEVVAS